MKGKTFEGRITFPDLPVVVPLTVQGTRDGDIVEFFVNCGGRRSLLRYKRPRGAIRGVDEMMIRRNGGWFAPIRAAVVIALIVLASSGASIAACSPTICVGGNPCTISGVKTIDNGCSLDWGPSQDVVVTGTLTTAATGHSYSLSARNLTVSGTLQARGGKLVVRTTQDFAVQVVSNSAAKIDVERDGFFDVQAGGAALLHGKEISGDGTTTTYTGFIDVAANSIDVTSPIHANSMSGNSGGVVILTATAGVVVDAAITVNGGGSLASGGFVSVEAGGDIWMKKSVTANGDDGGFGGDVFFIAETDARIDGDISVRGVGSQGTAGSIELIAESTTITGTWKTIGTGGGGGDIDILSFGDTVLTTTSSLSSAGSAAGDGGDIRIQGGDIAAAGIITTNTAGLDSSSGSITLAADHDLTISGSIEGKSSNGGLFDSEVELSACNLSITSTGSVKTRNTMVGGGLSTILYAGSFSTAPGSSVMTDDLGDDGGNFVSCRCVDSSPADGVCDTNPATCASAPMTSGMSITPAITVIPIALPACS